MSILESTVNNIDSLNKTSIEQAKKRLDRLIKPQGSLGKMEDICMQLAGIHKSKYFDTSKKVVIAFGADHGVYEDCKRRGYHEERGLLACRSDRDDSDGTEVLRCNREGWHEGSLRFSIK